MKNKVKIVFCAVLFFISFECMCQNQDTITENIKIPSFKKIYNEKRNTKKITSLKVFSSSVIKGGGSSYRLMTFSKSINAFLAMYLATDSLTYLNEAIRLSDSILEKTKKGKNIKNNPINFKDDYFGWENINSDYFVNKKGAPHLIEVPLYESYLFRYLAQMAYILICDTNLSDEYREKGLALRLFIEKNGWEKWCKRGEKERENCYTYLFRSRTHMTAHWGMVALYLNKISASHVKKKQYEDFLYRYNHQLRKNLKLTGDKAYTWNMTWDYDWPFQLNCRKKSSKSIIQDVSHGNHVLAYIVASFELNNDFWKIKDIKYFSNTVKYILYDNDKKLFYADLNKQFDKRIASGSRMSDGFVKLARYDKSLYHLYLKTWSLRKNIKYELSDSQFIAQLHLAKKYLNNK